MSTYDSDEFEELKELVQQNHKILKSLQKKARLATAFSVIRWSVVIAIAIGLFTVLQPIIENIMNAYSLMMENLSSLNDAKNSVTGVINIEDIVKIFSRGE
jgi:uncharacterized membrane protein YukC